MNSDTWEFSFENARIIIPPKKNIATFSDTFLHYTILTTDMDNPNLTHRRDGILTAEKPQILSPHHFATILLQGFGPEAQEFVQSIRQALAQSIILKYGFIIKKTDTHSQLIREPIDSCLPKIQAEIQKLDDPLHTLLSGLEEGWEIILIKFTLFYIHHSTQHNIQNFQQRGLL
ncbi:MAG: hypothetical protein NZM04_02255 [Methylacidiphilales bacterium]|nr:hypothetical protein [Candidatus Methylacidiphilales bacterium]MDW8350020.1 hypothetical protein [Verrucomicrobiae bacterium]